LVISFISYRLFAFNWNLMLPWLIGHGNLTKINLCDISGTSFNG
jgi:hypothetical protein